MTEKELKNLKRQLDDPNFRPGWWTKATLVSLVKTVERERRKTIKLQKRIDEKYKEKLLENKD